MATANSMKQGALLIPQDALFVFLSFLHGGVLCLFPGGSVVALSVWWNSNTISHHFIHRPFFRSHGWNQAFSVYLTLITGVPQALWKHRHFNHHAGKHLPFRPTSLFWLQLISLFILWIGLLVKVPGFFLSHYLPGYCIGLGLCHLQGYFEHWRGTVSHYGWLYNFLFFNDGYHREHHQRPGLYWTELPEKKEKAAPTSYWPPILRWLDLFALESLERGVLRSSRLQNFVLKKHARAMQKVLPPLPEGASIGIVGGGLFPRTALILQSLVPDARLTVIDSNPQNIALAQARVGKDVEFRHAQYDPDDHHDFDLMVFPLAYYGSKTPLYRRVTAPHGFLIHDWMWNRTPRSALVSLFFLKRINLVTG